MRLRNRLALSKTQVSLVDTDRKSTRLNSSHGYISYAAFCLKKYNNVASARNATGSSNQANPATPSRVSTRWMDAGPPSVVPHATSSPSCHSPTTSLPQPARKRVHGLRAAREETSGVGQKAKSNGNRATGYEQPAHILESMSADRIVAVAPGSPGARAGLAIFYNLLRPNGQTPLAIIQYRML